ncbi:MAG: hypothetical protein A3C53_03935 [Omnitrophica WOR_2 bacterium RIFCSPHIGHO2_02_FULL_68_15]|nr:MAG: hypothetical protein A3C53_03935 [Omnitrophica WOR_2 bacterium RIFCSPHIGHO2_02_FULL_68_15]
MPERRVFGRSPARLPLRYRRAPDEPAASAETRDLGGGGVGLTLPEPFAVGTTLLVEVDLLDRGPRVRFTGEVAWSEPAVHSRGSMAWRPMAAGLRFVRIDATDTRFYRRLFPAPAA